MTCCKCDNEKGGEQECESSVKGEERSGPLSMEEMGDLIARSGGTFYALSDFLGYSYEPLLSKRAKRIREEDNVSH